MTQDIRRYGDDRPNGCWVKFYPGGFGAMPFGGRHLRYVRFDELSGKHHYTAAMRPWSDSALTLEEARLHYFRPELEAADAALEERERQAPDKNDEPEPEPFDYATWKFNQ